MSRKSPNFTLILIAALFGIGAIFPGLSVAAKDKDSKKAYLGVFLKDIKDEDREALNLSDKGGVLIEELAPNGPAQTAGLKSGDVIIELDGKKIKSAENIHEILAKAKPEQVMSVVVNREGQKEKVKLVLGAKPEEPMVLKVKKECAEGKDCKECQGKSCLKKEYCTTCEEKKGFLGVETQSLEDQLAEYFKVKSGALITKVRSEMPAEAAGLKAGDVITGINDEVIETTEQLGEVVRSHKPDEEVTVKYIRQGSPAEVKVKLAAAPSMSITTYSDDDDIEICHEGDFRLEDLDDLFKDINIKIRKEINREEFKRQMEELRQEMKELRQEIQEELKALKKEKKNK